MEDNDIVLAKRRVGWGWVYAIPRADGLAFQGKEPCTCHPDAQLPIIHEGDIIPMFRKEVVGFEYDDMWHEGRADFEIVEDENSKKKEELLAPSVFFPIEAVDSKTAEEEKEE